VAVGKIIFKSPPHSSILVCLSTSILLCSYPSHQIESHGSFVFSSFTFMFVFEGSVSSARAFFCLYSAFESICYTSLTPREYFRKGRRNGPLLSFEVCRPNFQNLIAQKIG
jgi:hypothetical protein